MEQLTQALKTALDMEKKGYELYTKAAKKTSNLLGKSTLEAIAKKEQDHMRAIDEFACQNIKGAISAVNPKSKKDYVKPIMDKLSKQLDKNITSDSDLKEAYKTAMELETNSFKFYKDLRDGSKDAEVKKFFEFLMGEENTHYELLSDTLEYLDDPKDWYREQEKWIVEG
jgi:rubrerythrin